MITGSVFRDAIISGANNIAKQKHQIDQLNVFPVPDGDTGTNMCMTITSAARELSRLPDDCTVSQVVSCAANALLRGARGNSGVILSLIFRGFSKSLSDCESANTQDLAKCLMLGAESAYKAVMKPTEGTILTVIRLTAKKASALAEKTDDVVSFWEKVCKYSNDALDKTPEILPVLKKAGVVDAGGKGLCVIFEGMLSVIRDNVIISENDDDKPVAASKENKSDFSSADYSVEFTVIKNKSSDKDSLSLRAYLESIGSDLSFNNSESEIKISFNTEHPGKAITQAIKHGVITSVKIENLGDIGSDLSSESQNQDAGPEYVSVDPDIPFGFVSVCAGEGVASLFSDLGVDKIVSGGQTMNPSTDDILAAIQSIPAKTVFVLPNNKNIIMAAEQAVPLADRDVRVLHTKTIPQGISAMLCFDETASVSDNQIEMMKAAENVGSGQITFAARDSDYEGHKIKEGQLLAIENGKLSFVEDDLEKAAVRLTRSLIKKTSSYISIIYGEGVSKEDAESVVETLKSKIGDTIDISLIEGKQPVYYYIISVE